MAKKWSQLCIQREYDRNQILRSKCDFAVTQCGNLIGGNQYLPVGALYPYGDAKFEFRARKNPMVAVYSARIKADIAQYAIV